MTHFGMADLTAMYWDDFLDEVVTAMRLREHLEEAGIYATARGIVMALGGGRA